MATRVEKTSQDSPSGSGSDRVRTGSLGSGQPPNPELDFGSGSAPMLNSGPDLGPVHQSSGPDQSSEPNCSNPKHHCLHHQRRPCHRPRHHHPRLRLTNSCHLHLRQSPPHHQVSPKPLKTSRLAAKCKKKPISQELEMAMQP